jgi:protein SCO1/2
MRTYHMLFMQFFLITLILSGCTSYAFKAATIEPPDQAYNFALTDQNEKEFTLSQVKGKVALLFFGYTNCPDVCPATLSDLQIVLKRLGTNATNVAVLFVTVDPERDTPERLRRFVSLYDPATIALTGTSDELTAVYKAYGAGAQRRDTPESALVYMMDHTSTITVIDKQGQRRLLIGFGTPIDDIVSDINALIAE